MEQLANLFSLRVDRGHHDVAGRFVTQLDDPFAQVGVNDFDPMPLEERVEVALLGQHRLALHELFDVVLLQDPQHDLIVFGSVTSPMNMDSILPGVGFELLQQIGQVRERVLLDP